MGDSQEKQSYSKQNNENRNGFQSILQNKLQALNMSKILPNPATICDLRFKNLLIASSLCHLNNLKHC